jgi:spore coat protein D
MHYGHVGYGQWGAGGCHPPVEECPPQVFPAQYDPGSVSPPKEYVKTNVINKVVSHVHPSHTTTVNKHVINHQHYFPHTESCVNECCETHTMCGAPVNPCCAPVNPCCAGPMAFGHGPGFGYGPGFGHGMGWGPGFGY